MLDLEITGHNSRKKLTTTLCEWFYLHYLSNHNISLRVNFRGLRREGAWGWCSPDDDKLIPSEFLIELHNRMDVENHIKILCHELVHVWQHARGDLIYRGPIALWKNVDYSDVSYEDMPWEWEAVEMEDNLYEAFLSL